MSAHANALKWALDLLFLARSAIEDDPEDALKPLLQHIVQAFGANSGTLAMVDPGEERARLRIVAGIDLPEGVLGQTIELGIGILGGVAQRGEPIILNGRVQTPQGEGSDRRSRPGAAICWPVKINRRLIGALSVNRRDEKFAFTPADIESGAPMVTLLALMLDNFRMHREQLARIEALSRLNGEMLEVNAQLKATQAQLLHSEKMASIGQLAAGVAHEINNPIGYVYSNLSTLGGYVEELLAVAGNIAPAQAAGCDLEFLAEDIPQLLSESREGLDRVKKIVQDLKDFSRSGSGDEWEWCDVTRGLVSTLNIVHNELKYKVTVQNELQPTPDINCLPSQLNQVFMNLLVNAGQAIGEKGNIWLRSGHDDSSVWIEVEDNGCGIGKEQLNRIFEPFFTTKPVGKGTGLGLSVSYAIVRKHGGEFAVDSTPGKGSRFRVPLPRTRSAPADQVALEQAA
jgi:two-component system NtrC family sensor kinase